MDKNFELMLKMDAVLTEATNRIQYYTLLEEAGEGGEENVSRLRQVGRAVSKAWFKFWDMVERITLELIDKIKAISHGNATLKYDVQIYQSLYNRSLPSTFPSLIRLITRADGDPTAVSDEINSIINIFTKDGKITIKAGEKPKYNYLYNNMRQLNNFAKQIKKAQRHSEDPDINRSLGNFRGVIRGFIKECKDVIKALNVKNKPEDSQNVNNTNTESIDLFAKEGNNMSKTKSIMNSGLTNQQKAACLLQEAAYMLLNEDGAGLDDVEKDDTAVQEFDDVPEETPVEQPEYNTANVGGDDEDPDLEEIKDLAGGDSEVIGILTKDEDSAIIDADGDVQNESFNLDW